MTTHDAEVRRAALDEAIDAILKEAPPANAELSMHGGDGPFVDRGMEAYIEGIHTAYEAVRALGDKENTE